MQLLEKLGGKVPDLTSQDIQNLGLIDVRSLDTGSNGVLEAIQYVFLQTWILALGDNYCSLRSHGMAICPGRHQTFRLEGTNSLEHSIRKES